MSKNNLRLLSLDGGGVRGLSSLFILKQLMERIDPEAPPKPCDYFDMIGGTSTGGLIAIMLGRLEMSVDECIEQYCDLAEKVFGKSRSLLTAKLKIRGRFDGRALEKAIKDIVRSRLDDEDALLKGDPQHKCKVFVCATSTTTSSINHLTSYWIDRGTPLLETAKIWEAARATSAAPSFFDPIKIGSRYPSEFVDGATGANNPVNVLLEQASDLWNITAVEHIHCLVSIGTGRPAFQGFGATLPEIFSALKRISTETERTAEAFLRAHSSLRDNGQYFRFNVENGLEDVRLNEHEKLSEIREVTYHYIQSQITYQSLGSCARQLKMGDVAHEAPSVNVVPHSSVNVVTLTKVCTYTRRAELSQKLEDLLQIKQKGSTLPHAVAICGLGGTGKSQLALDFVEKHKGSFRTILWIDATDRETVKASFQRCALELELISSRSHNETAGAQIPIMDDPAVSAVRKWLSSKIAPEDRWLVVIDNADDVRWGLQKIVPEGSQGNIIITSQDNLSTKLAIGGCERLDVGVLSESEAVSLLYQHLKAKSQLARDTLRGPCEELVQRLGGLALAVDLAGAYISQSTDSEKAILQYLEDYDRHQDELLQLNWFQGLLPTEKTVWTVWDATLKRISKDYKNTPVRPDAWLTFLAHFRGTIIQDEIFRLGRLDGKWTGMSDDNVGKELAEEIRPILQDLCRSEQVPWDSFRYRQACKVLFRYNLIQPVKGKWPGVTMHNLVKWRAAQYGQQQQWKKLYQCLIAAVCNRLMEDKHPLECRRELFLHLPSPTDQFSILKEDPELIARNRHIFNHTICSAVEERIKNDIVKLKEEAQMECLHDLSCLKDLAQVYEANNGSDEAKNLFMQAFEISKKGKGYHPTLCRGLTDQSIVYLSQGKFHQAEFLLLFCVNMATESDHAYMRKSRLVLAGLYIQIGKLDKANQLVELTMEDYRTRLDSDPHINLLHLIKALLSFRRSLDSLRF